MVNAANILNIMTKWIETVFVRALERIIFPMAIYTEYMYVCTIAFHM